MCIFQTFGHLLQLVSSRTLPKLCTEQQLTNYLEHMNNETFLSWNGYQFFAHARPLANLHPSKYCHDLQNEDSGLVQDRSSCPWFYQYSRDRLRFPQYILTAYPKRRCFPNDDVSPRHCRNLALPGGGANPNGVCDKIEIEVLTFRKQTFSDQCYTVEDKQNITLAFSCVYQRTQTVSSQKRIGNLT